MIRKNQMRLVADHEPIVDLDAGGAQFIDFVEERLRIDDNAVADHARDPRMQDSGGQQPQNELPAVRVDRVPGIVPALIARDDAEVGREQVDDLPFAFVAPLCAENGYVHASQSRSILPSIHDSSRR
jgi:hypothetical protein